jgi:hypothetical protein
MIRNMLLFLNVFITFVLILMRELFKGQPVN